MTATPSPSLVDQICGAGPDELKDIDAKIADLEAKQVNLQNQIDALQKVRRVIDVRLHGKPQRKPRQPRKGREASGTGHTTPGPVAPEVSAPQPPAPSAAPKTAAPDDGMSDFERRVFTVLQKGGPQTAATIAAKVAATPASVVNCVTNCSRFSRAKTGMISIDYS
ncbi:hypothetical protein [Bremerella cremea]|uniref:hypothetical protein n=1 Tax=Bremerella cremea TaxID=1031537 RepID=UPI0031EEBC92